MVTVMVSDVVPSFSVIEWLVTPGVSPAVFTCTSSPAGMPGASKMAGAPLLNDEYSAASPPVVACTWALKVFASVSETACVGGSMPCGVVKDRLLPLMVYAGVVWVIINCTGMVIELFSPEAVMVSVPLWQIGR